MINNNIILNDNGSISIPTIDGVIEVAADQIKNRLLIKFEDEVYSNNDFFTTSQRKKLHRLSLWQESFKNSQKYIDSIVKFNTNPSYLKDGEEILFAISSLKKSAVTSYSSPFTAGYEKIDDIEGNKEMSRYKKILKEYARDKFKEIWNWSDFDELHTKILNDRHNNIAHRDGNAAGFKHIGRGFCLFNQEISSLSDEDLRRMCGIVQLYNNCLQSIITELQTEIKNNLLKV
jgi:hypothetical protein